MTTRIAFAALTILLALGALARAAQDPIVAGLRPDNVDRAMELEVAKIGGAVAIYGRSCGQSAQYYCEYAAAGPFKIVATAKSEDSDANSVSVVWMQRSDTDALLVYVALLVKIVEPQLTNAKQGVLVKKLIEGAPSGFASVEGDNANFSVVDFPGQGMWFTAAKR